MGHPRKKSGGRPKARLAVSEDRAGQGVAPDVMAMQGHGHGTQPAPQSPMPSPHLATSPPRHLALSGSFANATRGRLRPGGVQQLASQRAHRDQSSLASMISQCQQAERENLVAQAIIGAKADLIIGDGPTVKAASDDPAWNDLAEDLFSEWCAQWADASGQLTFDQMVASCPMMWDTDGGVLFHKVEASGREPGRLETIEVARLANPRGIPDSDLTRAGVTTDERGRPITFHVGRWSSYGVLNTAEVIDVDADEMIYLPPPRRLRPGMVRSEPQLYAVLPELEFLFDSAHAVHTGFVMAAQAALVIEQGDVTQDVREALAQALVDSGEATSTTAAKEAGEWRSGAVLYTGMGEKVSQIKPEHPTTQYVDFYREQLRVICSTLGIPLSCVLYLFDRSYSASRAELAVMGRRMARERWYIEQRLLTAVWRFWVAGEIAHRRLPKVNGWERCRWTWPSLPVLDPKIEISARADQVAAGLCTRERALRDLGVEMEIGDFYRERAAEIEIERKIGITTSKPTQESVTVSEETDESSKATNQQSSK